MFVNVNVSELNLRNDFYEHINEAETPPSCYTYLNISAST